VHVLRSKVGVQVACRDLKRLDDARCLSTSSLPRSLQRWGSASRRRRASGAHSVSHGSFPRQSFAAYGMQPSSSIAARLPWSAGGAVRKAGWVLEGTLFRKRTHGLPSCESFVQAVPKQRDAHDETRGPQPLGPRHSASLSPPPSSVPDTKHRKLRRLT
jgi:hypothetical protein